ncbi:MAG: glycosyltransferase family 4 protein [Bacteroidota bacterium]
MKILIISPRFPFRQGKADSMTVFHMIEYFHKQGREIILATFDNEERFSNEEREELKAMCKEVRVLPMKRWKKLLYMGLNILSDNPFQVAYYGRPEMQRIVDELIASHQPDVLYAHLIRASSYLEKHRQIPTVVGMQIAQTLNYGRLIQHEKNRLRRIFYTQEYRRVKKYEPQVVAAFDRILLISPHDRKAVATEAHYNKIFFNPHGVDVAYYSEDLQRARRKNVVAMNGDFGVPTNMDGAHFFYREVYPLVKAAVPDTGLWLVGRNPHPSILQLAQKDQSVTVTGRVPDIRPFLQEATVGIAPMRVAAGLQNKILVSLASELPMVVTPIANEGIGAPVGEVLVEAQQPQDFADQVIQLLQNSEERARIGQNAQAFMQTYWTWDFHFQKLEEMLGGLIADRKQAVENYYPFSGVEVGGG